MHLLEELGKKAATTKYKIQVLSEEEKNEISHRGKALRAIRERLEAKLA